jgi:hypothetical protein
MRLVGFVEHEKVKNAANVCCRNIENWIEIDEEVGEKMCTGLNKL